MGDRRMSHLDDKVYLQFDDIFKLTKDHRWRYLSVDQDGFGTIPYKNDFYIHLIHSVLV